jgi:hypothetical protein
MQKRLRIEDVPEQAAVAVIQRDAGLVAGGLYA